MDTLLIISFKPISIYAFLYKLLVDQRSYMKVSIHELCCIKCDWVKELAPNESAMELSCPTCGNPVFSRKETDKIKFLKMLKGQGVIA